MSATQKKDIVIIGAGIAAITTVREVRKRNANASLTLITADDGVLYAKPMLSNAFALGKPIETLAQKSAADFAAEMNITMHVRTRVVDIQRAVKTVRVEGPDGPMTISYDRLVLATGASARAYRVEGSDGAPLYSVNDLDDYTRLRAALKPGARVLIIGAGLIGSEFANDMADAGHAVTLVDPAPWPLGRLLPQAIGQALADALGRAGVTLHMGHSLTAMAPNPDGGWVATLDSGHALGFDLALSAIGLVANTQLAKSAGLTVDQGVRVDAFMRTSDSAIYALGDCAQTDAGVLPYIMPTLAAARALAQTLTDGPTPVHLPAMPVSVKTPALACVVCPPPVGLRGEWTVTGQGTDLKALFMGETGETLGFALSGAETKARQAITKAMPDLLAA